LFARWFGNEAALVDVKSVLIFEDADAYRTCHCCLFIYVGAADCFKSCTGRIKIFAAVPYCPQIGLENVVSLRVGAGLVRLED